MNLDSFIKKIKLNRICFHLVASLILLGCFTVLSYSIDNQRKEEIVHSLQAMFRSDRDIGNTSHLLRRFADFETLDVIKCVNIKQSSAFPLYSTEFKSNCSSGTWQYLIDPMIQAEIPSIEGENYTISFRSESIKIYRIYMGLFFLLTLLSLNILIKLHWAKMDLKVKQLQNETELNRILDEKVRDQSAKLLSAQLESAIQQSRLDMAKRMAHDIRSPLSVINIVSSRLKKQFFEEGDLLENASKQIMVIAAGMLATDRSMYKENSEPQPLKPHNPIINKRTSIRDLIIATEQSFNLKIVEFENQTNLRFSLYNEVNSNGYVNVDEIEFRRILSNLLNNAIESVEDDGFVALSIFLNETSLVFEIRDSGIGMTEAFIEEVQKKSVTRGKTNGSGLGLFPSLKLIESWGGKLDIYSKVNAGTKISITLNLI